MKTLIVIILILFSSFAYADNIIIYCHAGWGDPTPMLLTDVKTYQQAGFEVILIAYAEEDGLPLSASEDIERVIELAQDLKWEGHDVFLIGVSRGTYVALEAFIRHRGLFEKVVVYMPLLDMENYDWSAWNKQHGGEDLEIQAYFREMKSPMALARERFVDGERILLLCGGRDKLSPASDCREFAELTDAEYRIYRWAGHNVNLNRSAKKLAVEFMGD